LNITLTDSCSHGLPEDGDKDEEMMDVDTDTRNPFPNTEPQALGHGQPPLSTQTPQHFFPPGSTTKPKNRKEGKSIAKGTVAKADMSELLTGFSPCENHRLSKKFSGLQNHRGRDLSAREIFMRRKAGGKPKDIVVHPKKRGVAMPRYSSLRGKLGYRGHPVRSERIGSEGVSVGSSRLRDRLAKRRQLKQQKREENEVTALFQGLGLVDGNDERRMGSDDE
jgi:hypothetical protein